MSEGEHVFTRTHARTHARAYTYIHINLPFWPLHINFTAHTTVVVTEAFKYTLIHTYTHTHLPTYIHICIHTYIHTYTYTYTREHMHTCMHTHAPTAHTHIPFAQSSTKYTKHRPNTGILHTVTAIPLFCPMHWTQRTPLLASPTPQPRP